MAKATRDPKKEQEQRDKIKVALADAVASQADADVFLYNFGIDPEAELRFRKALRGRKNKRPNLLLFLTTEGGDPDTAYRMARMLQSSYAQITAVVCGWCKSAGTLMCIGANDLVMCEEAELGPLDIQIAKADEWEAGSGLAIEAAFEKLQEESVKLFLRHLQNIRSESGSRITFRTASEIASQMVIGVTRDVFAKFDPLSIGEDHRSNLVAQHYGQRLNLRGRNLYPDSEQDMGGLRMLLRGYPSHSFVIDFDEARNLFRRVKRPKGQLAELTGLLGMEMVLPRHARRNQIPRMEFLNNEKRSRKKAASPSKGRRGSPAPATGTGAKVISGHISPSSKQNPGRKDAA